MFQVNLIFSTIYNFLLYLLFLIYCTKTVNLDSNDELHLPLNKPKMINLVHQADMKLTQLA